MMPKIFLYYLTFTVASFYSIVDHSGHCVSCKECIQTVKCVSQVKKIYGSKFIDQYSPVNSRVPLKVTYFQHKPIITRVHQCCKMGLHREHYLLSSMLKILRSCSHNIKDSSFFLHCKISVFF